MTLYEQLMYNWERGYYSVIEDRDRYYRIAHHKCGKDDFIFVTNCYETVKIAIHNFFVGAFYNQNDLKEYGSNWKIVDTIHPSELMGKGFQVGDKVEVAGGIYTLIEIKGPKVMIRNNTSVEDIITDYNNLKPVLPGEEKIKITYKSHSCKCRVWDCETRSDGTRWFFPDKSTGYIQLPPTSSYAICSNCCSEINESDVEKAVKLLKEKGIIKDGNYKPVKEAVAPVSEPHKESNSIPLIEPYGGEKLQVVGESVKRGDLLQLNKSDGMYYKFKKEEKKECEHEFERRYFVEKVHTDTFGVQTIAGGGVDAVTKVLADANSYWCCEKCGLVTCKNPNQE